MPRWGAGLLAGMLLVPALAGQEPAADPPVEMTPSRPRRSPQQAWEEGDWQGALDGYLDLQVRRPEDPDVMMNVGSSHYRLGDFESAARSFAAAAGTAEAAEARAGALYDLGNAAYRQGQLDEAIRLYDAALDLAPSDEDAKYNLEFVREEKKRRQEEAEKRRQQQRDQQEQDQQGSSAPGAEGAGQGQQEAGEGSDRDQDGLSDRLEEEGRNPTDPQSPDTDGDGLLDGEEDANHNGALDPGETDPNRADTDGDGVADGAEARDGTAGEERREGAMSEAEAARLLDALEEGKPHRRAPAGRARAGEKDW